MRFLLQTVRSNRFGFEHLGELYHATKDVFADEVVLDFARVTFFEANMAAPLAVIVARITDSFNSVRFENIQSNVASILRKNKFLTQFRFPTLEDTNQTTMPFIRLQLSDGRLFEDYVQKEFRGKGIPRMSERLGKVFKKKVFEVFENAVLHSRSGLGVFVCGQYYPTKNRLDITLADAGVGIRENVRDFFNNPKISSVAAIRWALQESNTTKKGPQPGGLGFKFLHEFVTMNGGRIQIASRFGFYEYHGGDKTFNKLSMDFPGTAVTIEINTADNTQYCLQSETDVNEIF